MAFGSLDAQTRGLNEPDSVSIKTQAGSTSFKQPFIAHLINKYNSKSELNLLKRRLVIT